VFTEECPRLPQGANLANRDLIYIGVSGDGDTASIGMGQFAHVMRRNLNMTYMVENNGCYGLTKGQDSATMDTDSVSKKGDINAYMPIDLVRVGIEVGGYFCRTQLLW
jgi:2-oxoglutarate ferredoxin oxidoreductase subunit beta